MIVILTPQIYFCKKFGVIGSLLKFFDEISLKNISCCRICHNFLVQKFFLHYKICLKIIPPKLAKSVRKYFRRNFIRRNFWVLMYAANEKPDTSPLEEEHEVPIDALGHVNFEKRQVCRSG